MSLTEYIVRNKRINISKISKEIEMISDAFIKSVISVPDIIKNGIGKAFSQLFLAIKSVNNEELKLVLSKVENVISIIKEKVIQESLG